jgi:hypothetical protein
MYRNCGPLVSEGCSREDQGENISSILGIMVISLIIFLNYALVYGGKHVDKISYLLMRWMSFWTSGRAA